MNYLAQITIPEMEKFKNNKKGLGISKRACYWIGYLTSKKEFDLFFEDWEGNPNFKRMNLEDTTQFQIFGLDRNKWAKFGVYCSDIGMSRNYALNLLIEEYNRKGKLFRINLSLEV